MRWEVEDVALLRRVSKASGSIAEDYVLGSPRDEQAQGGAESLAEVRGRSSPCSPEVC